jgi:hypothetical protein
MPFYANNIIIFGKYVTCRRIGQGACICCEIDMYVYKKAHVTELKTLTHSLTYSLTHSLTHSHPY